ncbi:MAG: hypothetical protein ACW98X_17020 [Promethearchaeota archaeon]|jgi:hypothetical protein
MENLSKDDSTEPDFLNRLYNCPKCKKTHVVKLQKDLFKNKVSYPFPYAYLHSSEGNLNDLLTILYLDKQLQIRGVDIIEIQDSLGIFSEELTRKITETLMDEIVSLQEENFQLNELLNKIEINELDKSQILTDNETTIDNLEDLVEVEEESIRLEIQEEEKDTYKKTLFTIRTKTPTSIQSKTPEKAEKITIYFLSTIGPGEKRQKLVIDTSNLISKIKETIGNMYGLNPLDFHFASEGITFDESLSLKDYNLVDGDEILIIPSSTAG